MKPRKTTSNRCLALAALCGLALAAIPAHAQVIYYDDFSGSTSTTLVGTAPDTRPGTQTWSGDTAAVTAGGTFGGQYGNVRLSFTPQSGNIYELSAVITTNTTQPVYFGFQQRNWSGPLWEVQDIVYAQVSSGSASLTQRDGFTSSGLGSGSFSSGGTVSIVLDATDASAANWTLDLLVNGSAVASDLSTSTVNLGNIDYVSIHDTNNSAVANGNVTIDDFTLRIVPDLGISSLSPADDAINVAVDTNLVLTFDKNVKASGSGSIELWKDGGTPTLVESFVVSTSPNVSIVSSVVNIDPTSDLEPASGTDPSVGYYVLIDADALVSDDADEDPFAGFDDPTDWNFHTEGAPQIASLSPADDATGVSPLLPFLVATFDEPVAAGTGSIELWKDGGGSAVQTFDVTVSSEVNISGSQATVTVGSALDASTGYHVKIDTGAFVDVSAGNPFAGISDTTSWSFTTGSGVPAILADINADGTNRTATTADFEAATGLAAGTFSSDSVTVFGGTEEGGAYSETVDNVTLAITDKSGGADGWFGAGSDNNLLDDGFFNSGTTPQTITLSGSGLGLAANRQYELYLFAGRSQGHDTTFRFDVNNPGDPSSGVGIDTAPPVVGGDETLGTALFTFSTGATPPASLVIEWDEHPPAVDPVFAGFALRDTGAAGSTPGDPYDDWSGGEVFSADKNSDGVDNGLAWLLGAADPDAQAAGLLPDVSNDGTYLTLSFSMLKVADRDGAEVRVQWSTDVGILDDWTDPGVLVPEATDDTDPSGVEFVIDDSGSLNQVTVKIPLSLAVDNKLQARLKGMR